MIAEQERRALGVAVVRGHEHGPVLGRLVLPARGRQPAGFDIHAFDGRFTIQGAKIRSE